MYRNRKWNSIRSLRFRSRHKNIATHPKLLFAKHSRNLAKEEALEWLDQQPQLYNALILTDSRSVLMAIKNTAISSSSLSLRKLLYSLYKKKTNIFFGLKGIKGNDQAYTLTRDATLSTEIKDRHSPIHLINLGKKECMKRSLEKYLFRFILP